MEKLAVCRIRIPKEWSELLKEEGRDWCPPKSREAIMYEMIASGIGKINRRNVLRELKQEQGK